MVNNQEFIRGGRNERVELMSNATVLQFFKLMNLQAYYGYSNNISTDGVYKDFNVDSIAGSTRILDDDALPDDEDTLYSAKWNGYFTRRQLEYLDAKYDTYLSEHNLDTEHLRDAAKKHLRLSMWYDEAMNGFRKGGTTVNEVDKVARMYEKSSESNMFAASKRKPGEADGGTSFSEIAARLATTGKIEAARVEWDKDTCDIMLDEYYAIAAKIGAEGAFG